MGQTQDHFTNMSHMLMHICLNHCALNIVNYIPIDWSVTPPTCTYYKCRLHVLCSNSQIATFMGPTWGPPGSCRPQMGPMLAPWPLLSREVSSKWCLAPRIAHVSPISWSTFWKCSFRYTHICKFDISENAIFCIVFKSVYSYLLHIP